jgi:hypothetical protein
MYSIKYSHHKDFAVIGEYPIGFVAISKNPVALIARSKCHLCEMHHEGRTCSAYCEVCWKEGCGKQEHPTWKHAEWVKEQKKKMGDMSSKYEIEVIVHSISEKSIAKKSYHPRCSHSSGDVHLHYHFTTTKSKDDSSPHWHHPMAKAYGIPARHYR